MARVKAGLAVHTGITDKGNIRDVKIERIGKVTIYQRGKVYYLYYRERGGSHRPKVDGNLAVARATAAKVSAALAEDRPSPLGFQRTSPDEMVKGFLDYAENVQGLAWRTIDRYRAALQRLQDFCRHGRINAIDLFKEGSLEDFIKWLRGQTRVRNGMEKGKKEPYKTGGIKFILGACRTAYNWAGRRHMLPPYTDSPFSKFPIDQLRDSEADEAEVHVFTPQQERAFFAECSEWQKGVFLPLATYGMRVGEWTYLLIENVDFEEGIVQICSKPEMFWRVKTGRRRKLPLTPEMSKLFKGLIGRRQAGFVLLNEAFADGTKAPVAEFESDEAFRKQLQTVVEELETQNPAASRRDKRRAVVEYCRAMGQVPVKRVQNEFCKLTEQIGCPEFTRTHDLRHLFATRAQESGANPLVVQMITGHKSLSMLGRYTHLSVEAQRDAMKKMSRGKQTGSLPRTEARESIRHQAD
jgi:integrase